MSGTQPGTQGGPILPGSPLAQALDDYAVPGLSADFADRVIGAAEARPPLSLSAPLPQLRRGPVPGRGWRIGRRFAIGALGFGALATAAAATGLLQRMDLPVPSAEKVWASITGAAPQPPARAPTVQAPEAKTPAALASVEIVGPIDTPEELGEAFRRIDEVRKGRREARSAVIDRRIEAELERRRAAGLPLPTAEEQARLRQRIAEGQARRQQLIDDRVAARRTELERQVEAGEALTREDVVRAMRDGPEAIERRERIERLLRMPRDERRRALRQLPPEERRALLDEWRQRRQQHESEPVTTASASPPSDGTEPPPFPEE